MMLTNTGRGNAIFCTIALLLTVNAPARAQMKFYYDPATGNVAFDTTGTRSGYSYSYGLTIDHTVPWEFRYENQIRLSNSSFYLARTDEVSDSSLTIPFQGLYTIGDVMPIGLSELEWKSFRFQEYPRSYTFADVIGGGWPPPAEFIYGPPEGEFTNRWDLVDPDALTWATAAVLRYQAATGEVLIDTTGVHSGYISAFELESVHRFLPAGYTSFFSGPLQGATVDTVFGFADAFEPGTYSLGKILSAGMTANDFESTFTNAKFLGRAGFKGGSFDFETDGIPMLLQYVAVPEPTSSLSLSIVGASLAFVRRRAPSGGRR